MGFGVSEPYIKVELTDADNEFKQICFTQEQLEEVYRKQATPGDLFYGMHMKLIHCYPETSSELAV